MSFLSKHTLAVALLLGSFVSAMVLPGCGSGGGTEGSGLKTFEGVVADENGVPLADVTVSVGETGAMTTTDVAGNFSVSTEVPDSDQVTLIFDKGGVLSAQATVSNLAQQLPVVSVAVQANLTNNTVQVIVAPPPTVAPTAVPPTPNVGVPTPTPTTGPGPTAVPTDTAAPTATPTPTATPLVVTSCYCNLDRSIQVNANDFQCALNLHAAGTFDFNQDGVTNGQDLTFFNEVCTPFLGEMPSCSTPWPFPECTS